MIDLGESIENVAKKMIAMNIWPQHVIETINLYLFNLINAPAHPSLSMLMLGHFFASDVIIVVPCILLLNWFFAKKDIKKTVLAATFSGVLAIGLNLCVSLFWRYPRPFMAPVGHTFITHVADVYFPYHISLISAVGISLLLQVGVRFQGSLLLLLGLGIVWGKIYMGMYFPMEIFGLIIVGFIAVLLCRLMWQY